MNDASRRDGLIAIGGLAAMAGLFLFFVFLPGQKQATAVRKELADAEQSVRDVPQRVAELESLHAEIRRREAYLAESWELMPAEFDLHAIVHEVALLADRSQVKVSRIEPLPAVTSRTYRTLPFRVGFAGTPQGIAQFLRGLENQRRLLTFSEATLTGDESANGGAVEGEMHFAVYARRTGSSDRTENDVNSPESATDTAIR